MNHALLCALYFVPRNHVAVYRSGCFAKYLPENGWKPTVLCQDWPKGDREYDPEFVGVLPPEVTVVRVPTPKPVGFYQRVWLRKLVPYVWAHRVPILWWRVARKELRALLQRQNFQVAWATSDPMSPLALAQEAAHAQGCPWIADLRDSFNVQHFGSWYKRPLFAYHERRMCRAADAITTVSNGLADVIRSRTGKPVHVLNNGFDPGLFNRSVPPRASVFRLIFAGKMIPVQQNPLPLLEALALCIDSKAIPADQIELSFYGSDLSLLRHAHPGLIERLPVHEKPRIPHHDIIRVMQQSDVLLVFAHAHERGVLTGKLFDYLGAGRAILAVPDDRGDVTAVLNETGAGVARSSPDEIASLLIEWFFLWKSGRDLIATRNERAIARYSRREQTKTLAALFNELQKRRS